MGYMCSLVKALHYFSLHPSLNLPFFSSLYHRGICQIFTNTFRQHTKKRLNLIHYINALILKSLSILSYDFSVSPRIKAEKTQHPKPNPITNAMWYSTLIKTAPKQALCTFQISSTYFYICLQFLTSVFTCNKEVSYLVLTARISGTQLRINTVTTLALHECAKPQNFLMVHIVRKIYKYLYPSCCCEI